MNVLGIFWEGTELGSVSVILTEFWILDSKEYSTLKGKSQLKCPCDTWCWWVKMSQGKLHGPQGSHSLCFTKSNADQE